MNKKSVNNDESTEAVDRIAKRSYKRENIINDIITIFRMKDISSEAKAAVVNDACWTLTERKDPVMKKDGELKNAPKAKIKGCDYWSKTAFEKAYKFEDGYRIVQLKDVECAQCKKDFIEGKAVTHEHLIPKRILANALFTDTDYALDHLELFLTWFKACVITKDEDAKIKKYRSSMPEEYEPFIKICKKHNDGDDCMWARYKETFKDGITIYKIKWEVKGNGWVPVSVEDRIEITSSGIVHLGKKAFSELNQENKTTF